MKKILVAVDNTKGSKAVLSVFKNLVRPPEKVILLHVERLEGRSLMIDMLGDAELSTLRESLKGTAYKEKLDRKAEKILNYYKKELEDGGLISVKTVIREGIPVDEIIKVAEEEGVELIITGFNGKEGLNRLITGCVSKDVERNAKVPVLVARDCQMRKLMAGKKLLLKPETHPLLRVDLRGCIFLTNAKEDKILKQLKQGRKKMKKVLIAVDSTSGSKGILSLFHNLVWSPEDIILLHIEQLEGNSLMTAMLSDSEMSTLKEALKGTGHKEALDERAEKVLAYYKKELGNGVLTNITTVIREGHPADEILKVADEEGVDLIIVGCSGKSRFHRFVTGCTARDVEKNAKVPVLITKGNGCGDHAHLWSGREAYAIR